MMDIQEKKPSNQERRREKAEMNQRETRDEVDDELVRYT